MNLQGIRLEVCSVLEWLKTGTSNVFLRLRQEPSVSVKSWNLFTSRELVWEISTLWLYTFRSLILIIVMINATLFLLLLLRLLLICDLQLSPSSTELEFWREPFSYFLHCVSNERTHILKIQDSWNNDVMTASHIPIDTASYRKTP
jgi:hypothetical protein